MTKNFLCKLRYQLETLPFALQTLSWYINPYYLRDNRLLKTEVTDCFRPEKNPKHAISSDTPFPFLISQPWFSILLH